MSSATVKKPALVSSLEILVDRLIKEFDQIPSDRKPTLGGLTQFIEKQIASSEKVYLNFICTHNSRRSHFAQLWAQAAAYYYNIPGVESFSGGTEATAFNPRAVRAMQKAGFKIAVSVEGENPVYEVTYSREAPSIKAFSKKYDDPINPMKDFAAVMTCSHADENCPVIIGASARVALTYDDPKEFDGTSQEESKYQERVYQIGREILYAFSNVKR